MGVLTSVEGRGSAFSGNMRGIAEGDPLEFESGVF